MRIWTGRAGSGKTTAILREIAALSEKGEGRQILLVPELNSHLMERRLAAATHNHGARTAEVLTFSRLADRVFSEVGGLAQQMLTPAGQLLTLQEAARRVHRGSGDSDHACCIEDRLSYLCCISHGDFSGGNGSDGTGKDSFGNGTQRCKEMDPVAWKYVLSAGRGDEDRSDPFHFI